MPANPARQIDIDIVVALKDEHVTALASALAPEFYVDDDALRRAVRQQGGSHADLHPSTLRKGGEASDASMADLLLGYVRTQGTRLDAGT